jgi:hypothetical protein
VRPNHARALSGAVAPELQFETGDDLLAAMRDPKTPLASFLQFGFDSDRNGILEEDFYWPRGRESRPLPSVGIFH